MSQGEDPLGPRVRALFSDLAHAGALPVGAPPAPGDAALDVRTGEAGCVGQGTRVRFSLALRGTHIEQVRYRAYGCPFTLASCEWLARQLSGRQLAEVSAQAMRAAVGSPEDWAVALGIPAQRLGRLLVIEDALQQALGRGRLDAAIQHEMEVPDGAPPAARSHPDDSMTDSG